MRRSYFTATAPLLEADPSLLAVSAFNDNGQAAYRGDPNALHRADFFPGLGWLMTRSLWRELGPKWPNERGFWDDWLREPDQRKGYAAASACTRHTPAPCAMPTPSTLRLG